MTTAFLQSGARALLLILALVASTAPRAQDFQLLASYPHYSKAFTQGLVLHEGRLYESSGLYGRSFVIYGDLEKPERRLALPDDFFAEGLTLLQERLYLLSWRKGEALTLEPNSLAVLDRFRYEGEGWGLTHNERELIMSDGSHQLRFLNPATFEEVRRLTVRYHGKAMKHLNELEWHKGLILANQWRTDRLLAIDERNGEVLAILDMGALFPQALRGQGVDVFNGIAYDAQSDTWLVTGKYWPRIYRVKLSLPELP